MLLMQSHLNYQLFNGTLHNHLLEASFIYRAQWRKWGKKGGALEHDIKKKWKLRSCKSENQSDEYRILKFCFRNINNLNKNFNSWGRFFKCSLLWMRSNLYSWVNQYLGGQPRAKLSHLRKAKPNHVSIFGWPPSIKSLVKPRAHVRPRLR